MPFLFISRIAADPGTPVAGVTVIEDASGRSLPGVEAFVFPADRRISTQLLGVFRSDREGRILLGDLAPGIYLLALNKPGYQVVLAQLNTRFLSLLRLRMPPQPPSPTATSPDPASMDWVLRLNRSDALKELESGGGTPPEGGPEPGISAASDSPGAPGRREIAARLPFQAAVSQWFSGSAPRVRSGQPETSGRETVLQFLGDLPGQGSWQVDGLARNLNTTSGEPAHPQDGEDRGASRLRVGVQYELPPGDSVAMAARYDRDRFRSDWSPESTPFRQDVRTLGYEASWSRKLSGGEDFRMGVGFVEAQGTHPGPEAAPDESLDIATPSPLRDRRWKAGARLAMVPAPDHQVRVWGGMNLYRQDVGPEGRILAPIQGGMGPNELSPRGWTLSLSGEDAWKISTPLSMLFGVDCHVSADAGKSSILLPRLGARHEGKRISIQGTLIVRTDAGGGEESTRAEGSFPENGPGTTFGYRAEIEHHAGDTWRLAGHLERSPYYADAERQEGVVAGGGDFSGGVWIDPAASAEEVGILVHKRLGGLDGELESDHGRIRGRVGGDGTEAPILSLADGEVQYLAVKARASVDRSRTRVHLDYRRYDGSSSLALSGGPARLSRMDLVVHQPLPFLGRGSSADWKLLFGYQDLNREATPAAFPWTPEAPDRVRRMSGGVGVRF